MHQKPNLNLMQWQWPHQNYSATIKYSIFNEYWPVNVYSIVLLQIHWQFRFKVFKSPIFNFHPLLFPHSLHLIHIPLILDGTNKAKNKPSSDQSIFKILLLTKIPRLYTQVFLIFSRYFLSGNPVFHIPLIVWEP